MAGTEPTAVVEDDDTPISFEDGPLVEGDGEFVDAPEQDG